MKANHHIEASEATTLEGIDDQSLPNFLILGENVESGIALEPSDSPPAVTRSPRQLLRKKPSGLIKTHKSQQPPNDLGFAIIQESQW